MNVKSEREIRTVKAYEELKQFIRDEIALAVEQEDCEKILSLVSTLELLIQVKQKITAFKPDIQQLQAKSILKEVKTKKKKSQGGIERRIPSPSKDEDIGKGSEIKEQEPEVEVKEQASPSSEKKSSTQGKVFKGRKTPDREFVFPMISSLMELGGIAPRKEVIKRIYEKVKHKLNEYDLSPVSYSKYVPRWKDTLHWVRLNLVESGIMQKGTERGVWALTDYGKTFYEMNKDKVGEIKIIKPSEKSTQVEIKTEEPTLSQNESIVTEEASHTDENLSEIRSDEISVNKDNIENIGEQDVQTSSHEIPNEEHLTEQTNISQPSENI